MNKLLTIGSLVYDDFDGIFFSYQSLRLNNQDLLPSLDLLVVDNNPDSPEGLATKDFCQKAFIRYEPCTNARSTSVRNKIFELAEAPYAMCIDPHVLFEPQAIKTLLAFYQSNPDTKDLIQGPLLMDCITGHDPMTHMDPVWRDHMWGTWAIDPRGAKPTLPPFEIPMQGLGCFSSKTEEWLKFNDNFIGFGGEEGYIHEKYRQAERTTWCLPFLRWIHRFSRPRGVPYPLALEHRIHNYFIAFKELGLDVQPIIDHFKEIAPGANSQAILNDLEGFRDAFLVQQGLKENSRVAPLLPDLTNQKNFEGAVDLNIPLKLPG